MLDSMSCIHLPSSGAPMYELYQPGPGNPIGGLAIPDFRRIKDGLRESIEKVRRYRAINPMTLNASYPLIRLLMSVNVSLSLPPDQYVDRVSDIAYDLARTMQFASPVSVGRPVSPSMFYGTGVTDIVLGVSEPFDLTNIEERWQDLQPIRVISHPLTDLWAHVPDGKFSSQDKGVAVVVINIPMLALQYRMWRRWERGTFAQESPRTLAQFLMAHPLPNMLYSHLDVALFNRALAMTFNIPLPRYTDRHPFFQIDWHAQTDKVLELYLKAMVSRRAEIDAVIKAFPTVSFESRYDVIRWPDIPFTYQSMHACIAAYALPTMFHLHLADQYNMPKDHAARAYLRRFFNKAENMNVLRNNLPLVVRNEIEAIVEQGILPFIGS